MSSSDEEEETFVNEGPDEVQTETQTSLVFDKAGRWPEEGFERNNDYNRFEARLIIRKNGKNAVNIKYAYDKTLMSQGESMYSRIIPGKLRVRCNSITVQDDNLTEENLPKNVPITVAVNEFFREVIYDHKGPDCVLLPIQIDCRIQQLEFDKIGYSFEKNLWFLSDRGIACVGSNNNKRRISEIEFKANPKYSGGMPAKVSEIVGDDIDQKALIDGMRKFFYPDMLYDTRESDVFQNLRNRDIVLNLPEKFYDYTRYRSVWGLEEQSLGVFYDGYLIIPLYLEKVLDRTFIRFSTEREILTEQSNYSNAVVVIIAMLTFIKWTKSIRLNNRPEGFGTKGYQTVKVDPDRKQNLFWRYPVSYALGLALAENVISKFTVSHNYFEFELRS